MNRGTDCQWLLSVFPEAGFGRVREYRVNRARFGRVSQHRVSHDGHSCVIDKIGTMVFDRNKTRKLQCTFLRQKKTRNRIANLFITDQGAESLECFPPPSVSTKCASRVPFSQHFFYAIYDHRVHLHLDSEYLNSYAEDTYDGGWERMSARRGDLALPRKTLQKLRH